jgi:hypothetical protein
MDDETFVREHVKAEARKILLAMVMAAIFERSDDPAAMAEAWAGVIENTSNNLDLEELDLDDDLKEVATQEFLNDATETISLALAFLTESK